jgi:shikimate kinase
MKNIILATGGGIILEEINQKLLVKNGLVIYLKADYDLLASRLKSDLTRPLLQGVDIKDKLKNLLKERDPIYKSISDYVIETKKKRATDIANEIEIIIKQL